MRNLINILSHNKLELDGPIETNLVEILYDGQLRALAAITINAIVIVAAQWSVIDKGILSGWLLSMLAVSGWRLWNYRRYLSKPLYPDRDTDYWRKNFLTGTIISSILWGSTAFLLVPANDVSHQAMIIAVLVGMSAGAVVTLAAAPTALRWYLALVLVPMIIRLFSLGTIPNFALGFLSIVYFYFLYTGAQKNYLALLETMQMRRSQEKANDIIEYQAYHDDLTGLANRRLLLDRLKVEIARAGRRGHLGAVLFLDLDRFKIINDSLGHRIGDSLLEEIGHRLKAKLRDEDTAARLGGDEFILLLSELGKDVETATTNAGVIAEHLQTVLSEPFDIEGHHLHISSSIGIALFPANGVCPTDLLKHADSAMYQAKSVGRNTTRFFMASMQEAVDRKLHLEKGLRNAIGEKELSLDFQVLKTLSGEVVGAECLLRWQHSQVGLIIPDTFIPVAEDSELILPLGKFVLTTACECLQQLQNSNKKKPPLFLSINISPKEFSYKDFSTEFLNIVKEHDINPEQLQIELTESALLIDIQDAQKKISELKAAGIKLAIDDFGTGQSSLAYLKHLPVDTIKIDRSFIKDIHTEHVDATIVETTITMAKKLGLTVVAEGVEDEKTLELLSEFDCDLAQGYYLGEPASFDKLKNQLEDDTETIAPLIQTGAIGNV